MSIPLATCVPSGVLRTRFLVVLLLLLACCGDEAEVGAGESYLSVATSNGSRFRWTATEGNVVDLYVELHDLAGEMPPGFASRFTPLQRRDWITSGVDTWMDSANTPYALEIASHALGEALPTDRTPIDVFFEKSPGGDFHGSVTVFTSGGNSIVSRVEIRINVPDNGITYSSASYQSLLRHELGHALGIIAVLPGNGTSHSPFQQDVMYPIAPTTALSTGDRATIRDLYALEPDLVRSDGLGGGTQSLRGSTYWGPLGFIGSPIFLGWWQPTVYAPAEDVLYHVRCDG